MSTEYTGRSAFGEFAAEAADGQFMAARKARREALRVARRDYLDARERALASTTGGA